MKDVDELFHKNNIKYFVESGTLLGTMRNDGQIPYDDDLDISIFQEDAEKILALKDDLNKLGYTIKIRYPDWYVISGNYIALDVFHIKKTGSIYRYANSLARSKWWRFFFYEKELFPLKRHKFGNIEVSIPNEPLEYLKRAYGDDCLKYAVFYGNHRFGYIGRTLKVPIDDVKELQVPAPFLGILLDRVK